MMLGVALRIIGGLVVLFGVAVIDVGYSNATATSSAKPDLSYFFWIGPLIIALGIAIIFLYRWSLVALMLLSFVAGIGLAAGSLMRVPFPWEFLNLLFSGVLLAPGVLAIRYLFPRRQT